MESNFVKKVYAETAEINKGEEMLQEIENWGERCNVKVVFYGVADGTPVERVIFDGKNHDAPAKRIIAQVKRIHKGNIAEAKKNLRALCRKKNDNK